LCCDKYFKVYLKCNPFPGNPDLHKDRDPFPPCNVINTGITNPPVGICPVCERKDTQHVVCLNAKYPDGILEENEPTKDEKITQPLNNNNQE
jgi:hypothetical protein